LRGAVVRPAPLDITAEQRMLHGLSEKQALRNNKVRGAFGGCTRDERMVRSIKKRFASQSAQRVMSMMATQDEVKP
jgi:hypothetical protein